MRTAVRLLPAVLLLLLLSLVPAPVAANHEPLYKAGADTLAPGGWEPHFVWLQDPYFNFLGEVWWRFQVVGEGGVDVLFMTWGEFQHFRAGHPYQTLVAPLTDATFGSQWEDDLTHDLPYILVFRNPGEEPVTVVWQILAELDWRRWQGQPPGPALDLQTVRRSPVLAPGDSWQMQLTDTAFYLVRAQPFVDMTSIVETTITGGTPVSVDVDLMNYGFHPEILRVPEGSTVRWTNRDGDPLRVEVTLIPGMTVTEPTAIQPPWPVLVLGVAPALAAVLLFRFATLRRVRR